MKHLRKTLSLLMVFCLLFGLSATVFAAGEYDGPTSNDGAAGNTVDVAGHVFTAYQIFSAEYAKNADNTDDETQFVSIKWGDGVDAPALWAALGGSFAEGTAPEGVSTNEQGLLKGALTDTVFAANDDNQRTNPAAYKLAEILSAYGSYNETNDTSDPNALAVSRVIYDNVVSGSGKATGTTLPTGYYLVADTSADDPADVINLAYLMMSSSNAFEPTVKVDVPTVNKQVLEKNDSAETDPVWGKTADHDIGDIVEFDLTGTLPSTGLDAYETYYYEFADTLSSGLTFVENSVKVYLDTNLLENPEGAAPYYEVSIDGQQLTVTFSNLKAVPGVTASSKIHVRYSAVLAGDDVIIGKPGNDNTVVLNYSNNPNAAGTGQTPGSKATVYTYSLTIHKVGEDGTTPLEGAGFTLSKWIVDSGNSEGGSYVPVGEEIKGEGVTSFAFSGLDAGDYRLVETTVPAGYNKAEDMYFTISHGDAADGSASVESVKNARNGEVIKDAAGNAAIKIEGGNGALETGVVNMSGLKLPSTGGIGTTIFYIVGGLLLVGAGVLLVAKKRMGGNE